MNKRQATIYKHTALGPSAHFTRSLVAPVKPRSSGRSGSWAGAWAWRQSRSTDRISSSHKALVWGNTVIIQSRGT